MGGTAAVFKPLMSSRSVASRNGAPGENHKVLTLVQSDHLFSS